MPKFEFIKLGHVYKLDDVQIPSVTSVLPYNFFGNDTGYSRERGQLTHKMIELYNMNNLDEESLDPVLVPYLEGYKKFKRENQFNYGIWDFKSGAESPCTELQLAGYFFLMQEFKETDFPYFELQLYSKLYRFAGTIDMVLGPPFNVFALHLKENGTYKVFDYTKDLRKNIQIFLSFLTAYKFKKQHNLLDKG